MRLSSSYDIDFRREMRHQLSTLKLARSLNSASFQTELEVLRLAFFLCEFYFIRIQPVLWDLHARMEYPFVLRRDSVKFPGAMRKEYLPTRSQRHIHYKEVR